MDAKQVETLERQIAQWKWGIAIVAVALVSAYAGYFFGVLKQPLAENADKWGAFGDFIGGLLNPLVAFAAFYWLTQSVKLQKQELSETRKALEEAAQAQKETALAQQKAVDIQLQTANSLQATARAQMDAANAQIDNARSSALMVRASLHQILMQYEADAQKRMSDYMKDRMEAYMKQGADWHEAACLLDPDLPRINAEIKEHHTLMTEHLEALQILLRDAQSPPKDRP